MPPAKLIDQMMLFSENVQQKRIKTDRGIKTTDPEKVFPEVAGRRVSRSSIFGRIQIVQFDKKERFAETTNAGNRPTDAVSI